MRPRAWLRAAPARGARRSRMRRRGHACTPPREARPAGRPSHRLARRVQRPTVRRAAWHPRASAGGYAGCGCKRKRNTRRCTMLDERTAECLHRRTLTQDVHAFPRCVDAVRVHAFQPLGLAVSAWRVPHAAVILVVECLSGDVLKRVVHRLLARASPLRTHQGLRPWIPAAERCKSLRALWGYRRQGSLRRPQPNAAASSGACSQPRPRPGSIPINASHTHWPLRNRWRAAEREPQCVLCGGVTKPSGIAPQTPAVHFNGCKHPGEGAGVQQITSFVDLGFLRVCACTWR
jgi:hypothetical protein